MAFQSAGLPSIAAATTDLWPSLASTLLVPFRASSALPRPNSSSANPKLNVESLQHLRTARQAEPIVKDARRNLPEFLRDSQHDAALTPRFAKVQYVPSTLNIRTSISNMDRAAIFASSPVVRRMYPQHLTSRPLSTLASQRASTNPLLRLSNLSQRRTYQTGGISRNLLAHMEESANRNPGSATAQNAFYQALLRANMPAIIVERYSSNRFATNPACDEAYQKALNLMSSNGVGGEAGVEAGSISGTGNLSATQIQAVSQALAASKQGGNVATAKGVGNGTKEGPLHVVVDESRGGNILKWVKFFLWFGFVVYLSLVLLTLLIDTLSVVRRPGSKADSEVKPEQQKVRFSDVHGAQEAKEELQDMVEFLKNPEKFAMLGGKLPKGILLMGPPGTGKTLLARAVAGEAGVPFFYMSGSEFDEMYVGVGAKRVRDLFTAAKAKSPAIIFIDELDAIGSRRNARDAAYHRQTLNQLLTELDGFDQNSTVVIIGATNFPESLDKALTRPGRFDRHVQVSLPDVRGRIAILQHHAKKVKSAKDVNFVAIAQTTSGLSGAELENIINQAAVRASKNKSQSVTQKDFEWAKDKVIMGAERKSMVISAEEKEMTAYHEAGHALVKLLSNDSHSKLYKVTVLPRGPTLGHTAYLPEMDKYSYTVENYLNMIDAALGGKLAEEIAYGLSKVTSGASSDLKHATSVAFQMIGMLGMSDKLGPMEFVSRYDQLSSETRAIVESEVQRLLTESYTRSRKLLMDHRKELDLLAKALVEYETLDKNEVEKVIRGEPLPDRIKVPAGPMTVPLSPSIKPGQVPPAPEKDDPQPPTPPAAVPSDRES